MNSITQDILYKQSVIKYSFKYGVTKAAIRFKMHRKTIYRWIERYDGTPASLKNKVYQEYKEENIELRVVNGDGAKWTKGITPKGGIYQKDEFHIQQEITRDLPKEYREMMQELVEQKDYVKIDQAIEGLKYELGGEEKTIKKLNALKSYLSSDLERYTDIAEIPEAPRGIEYRTMGTQESQIFSKLKKRFCSGRKAFSKHGANSLSKICVLNEKFSIEELETPIPIDRSVEDWIKEIEEQIRANKRRHCAKEAIKDTKDGVKQGHIELGFMKEIMKIKDFTEMRCSF